MYVRILSSRLKYSSVRGVKECIMSCGSCTQDIVLWNMNQSPLMEFGCQCKIWYLRAYTARLICADVIQNERRILNGYSIFGELWLRGTMEPEIALLEYPLIIIKGDKQLIITQNSYTNQVSFLDKMIVSFDVTRGFQIICDSTIPENNVLVPN